MKEISRNSVANLIVFMSFNSNIDRRDTNFLMKSINNLIYKCKKIILKFFFHNCLLWLLLIITFKTNAASDGETLNTSNLNKNITSVIRVPVIGNAATSNRRYATASKIIVTHEDLIRFGDATIAEALQRVPGISITQKQGKETEIGLRGLGSGYTQILIDGSSIPKGFSVESLSLDLIERIEVLKSPTADIGSQAIGGTINIIMKKSTIRPTRSAKLAIGQHDNRPLTSVSADYAKKINNLSWRISSSASLTNDSWPTKSETSASMSNGTSIFSRDTIIDERNRLISFDISPSLDYKIGEKTSLGLNGWIQANEANYSNLDQRINIVDQPPQFISDVLTTDTNILQGQLIAQIKTLVGEEGKFENKIVFAESRRNSEAELSGYGVESLLLKRSVQSKVLERSGSLSGKFLVNLIEEHNFSAGWDGKIVQRSESRLQHETSPVNDYPTEDLDENYKARIYNLAIFAQDEWAISSEISAYLGFRWEGLQTNTDGQDLVSVSNRSSVFSPMLQFVWKLPDTDSNQIRFNLGRTYKAPTARELTPRRWVVTDNSATTPNFQGNPDLLPELAWGMDVGYEHYFDKSSFVGVSAYARRIDNIILPSVTQVDDIWIETPKNSGKANVQGVEFEAKGKLSSLFSLEPTHVPDIDVHLGFTRNWSKIENIFGQGNRLASQPEITASIGGDWYIHNTKWTTGFNFIFEQGGFSRNSNTNSMFNSDGKKLDIYFLWTPDKNRKIRFSLTNILTPTKRKSMFYEDENIIVEDNSYTKSFLTAKAQIELTF
ncbi:TonB-dependent receptor [Acinetobacter sp. ACIN00229]|uniref:TonB-dependent receptor plug domain-containing protein n=1 Tax=Acinetobacter sp. ACIN00229 TaxID=2792607 RepID=UPI0018DF8B99|nr:TonB-dependent receptor [Acinetobacter sp. ACIN00229]MBI0421296.1 TonB-dependent receptor [Acinetobacter sp. ACIN00229]